MTTAIVGAGLSGLMLAERLVADGEPVTLFEKSRGPSGRASTRRVGLLAFDHGAQYFTARSAPFRSVVAKWCEQGVAAPWAGPFGTLRDGTYEPESRPVPRYVGRPSMSAIGRHLADGLDLRLGSRIASIEPQSSGWKLAGEGGDVFGVFERVLVTAPAPQTVDLLANVSDLARAAANVHLEPCLAVMVTFAGSIDQPWGGVFIEGSPLGWAAAQASKPGRSQAVSFVLQATPDWSRDHLDAPSHRVGKQLLRAFSEAIARPLPPVTHLSMQRWRYARPVAPPEHGCLWDAASGLGACGDWLMEPRIEGAVQSAWALADAIDSGARAAVG